MSTREKSIADLQAEIEGAIRNLGSVPLPKGLEGLSLLAPPHGLTASVSLRYAEDNRKIRSNADASYFDHDNCVISLAYAREEADEPQEAGQGRELQPTNDPIDWQTGLVVALDAAEHDSRFRDFVALKTFRDKFLPLRDLAWAADLPTRHRILSQAISEGLISTGKVTNPNAPNFPVTTIRLNRTNPRVRDLLHSASAQRSPFSPIAIRGGPLSATVIAERR